MCALLAMALLASAQARSIQTDPIVGFWNYGGGVVQVTGGPTSFSGTIVKATRFSECDHPVGEVIWRITKSGGGYTGTHRWFASGGPECKLGGTANQGRSTWAVVDSGTSLRLHFCTTSPTNGSDTRCSDLTRAKPVTPEVEPLRVNFIVSASGKPNLPLKGYASPRTLVGSRVSGSGHATFTKKDGALLTATETKGSIVHEDTYSDGTKHTLTFGIVSGTRYYPALRRLALVLKLKDSNDPDCEAGFLISTTFGTLTLLPHEDVGLNGGTVIFFGLPKTKLTDPCRHAHGWVTSPSARVRARIILAESKL